MSDEIARVIDAFRHLAISHCEPSAFKPRGLWPAFEIRDLGIAKMTGGRVGAFHMRAIRPFSEEQGFHWHRTQFHMVYILKGSVTYLWEGNPEPVVAHAGACLYQPPGAHNVIHYTADVEVLEITMPAEFETIPAPDVRGGPRA